MERVFLRNTVSRRQSPQMCCLHPIRRVVPVDKQVGHTYSCLRMQMHMYMYGVYPCRKHGTSIQRCDHGRCRDPTREQGSVKHLGQQNNTIQAHTDPSKSQLEGFVSSQGRRQMSLLRASAWLPPGRARAERDGLLRWEMGEPRQPAVRPGGSFPVPWESGSRFSVSDPPLIAIAQWLWDEPSAQLNFLGIEHAGEAGGKIMCAKRFLREPGL